MGSSAAGEWPEGLSREAEPRGVCIQVPGSAWVSVRCRESHKGWVLPLVQEKLVTTRAHHPQTHEVTLRSRFLFTNEGLEQNQTEMCKRFKVETG